MDESLSFSLPDLAVRCGRLSSICLLGAWPGCEGMLADHLREALGAELPNDGRRAQAFKSGHLYRVHPEKLLVVSPDDPAVTAKLQKGFDAEIGSLSDQGHSRMAFFMQGPGLWRLLRRILPLDPTQALPEADAFVQTRWGDANVLAHRSADEAVALLVPASFAASLWDALRRGMH